MADIHAVRQTHVFCSLQFSPLVIRKSPYLDLPPTEDSLFSGIHIGTHQPSLYHESYGSARHICYQGVKAVASKLLAKTDHDCASGLYTPNPIITGYNWLSLWGFYKIVSL